MWTAPQQLSNPSASDAGSGVHHHDLRQAPKNTTLHTYAPKYEQGEGVPAQVIPAGMAEGRGDELPPLRRPVVQREGCQDGRIEQAGGRKDSKVEQEQGEDAVAHALPALRRHPRTWRLGF